MSISLDKKLLESSKCVGVIAAKITEFEQKKLVGRLCDIHIVNLYCEVTYARKARDG